ncbi:MAG: pilus assembly protein CpaE, partial [Aeromicrobium sp.]|nr:pilus assembly protein CpaE [Aeromicrobium sp.]
MSRALILAGGADLVARINVMPGTQVVSLTKETIESDRFDLMRSLDPQSLPDVIFIGAALASERALEIARSIDDAYPSVSVFLVADLPLDIVVEAMRSGFKDVLPTEAPDDRIRDILRRAETHRVLTNAPTAAGAPAAQVTAASRTVTIVSPKGGVGKTSIATSLAIGLAENHPSDVVLVDLDLQFGDVASTLDLTPSHTIDEAMSASAASDNLIVKTMLTVHPSGFHVLCGAESPAATEEVTGPQVVRLLTQLATQFGFVIVDTAGGLSEPTLAALEVTDDIVIVSTMDVACVRGVRKAVELLSQIGLLPASRVLT